MKKGNISLMLVVVLILSLFAGITTTYANNITISDWAIPYYEKAKDYKILPKCAQKNDSTVYINREDACEFIVALYEELMKTKVKATHPNPFIDTKSKSVLEAHALGIVKGFSSTEFRPSELVNRESGCVIFFRLLKLIAPDIKCDLSGIDKYLDDACIAPWSNEAVYSLKYLCFVTGYGDGYFKPQNKVTMEQCVKLSCLIYDFVKAK